MKSRAAVSTSRQVIPGATTDRAAACAFKTGYADMAIQCDGPPEFVAGCRVIAGTVERGSRVRLIRESRIIGDYPIDSLRREKDDVKEVRTGYECGVQIADFSSFEEGDVIECYEIEKKRASL